MPVKSEISWLFRSNEVIFTASVSCISPSLFVSTPSDMSTFLKFGSGMFTICAVVKHSENKRKKEKDFLVKLFSFFEDLFVKLQKNIQN
jgi:hypothetical protein